MTDDHQRGRVLPEFVKLHCENLVMYLIFFSLLIYEYTNENELKVNKEKTSIIAFHSPRKHSPLSDLQVSADGTCLRFSTDVKSLEITLDQQMR